MELVLLLLALTLGTILIFFQWIRTRKPTSLPGPRGLPLLGNALQLDKDKPHLQLLKWAGEYGEIFKIQLFREEVVILNSYDAIYEALLSSNFAGRPYSWRTDYTRRALGISFHDFTDEFKTLKKTAHKGLRQYGDGMDHIIHLVMDEINGCIDTFETYGEKAFDPREPLYKCIMNIMLNIILGEQLSKKHDYFERVEELERTFQTRVASQGEGIELDIFPWLRFFGNKTYKVLQEYNLQKDELFSHWISEYRNQEARCSEDLMDTLIQAYDDGIMDLDNVYGIIADVFGAGIITTFSTTNALLLCLINNLEIQQKIHDEIDKVMGRENTPSIADRVNMPYTEAVILEALRYSTTTTLGIPRKTTQGTNLMGHYIPKDTMVWVNFWAMHHDPKYFVNPEEFRPERFLDSQGQLLPPGKRSISFLPFSTGRRVCLGETLAKARMFLIVTCFLQKFQFCPEDVNNIPSPDPRTFSMGITLIPPLYKVIAKLRD